MWTKILGFFMSIIMFIGSLLGISQPAKDVTDTADIITDKNSFSVSVDENPTTGYRWNQKIADESIVKLAKDDYIAPQSNGMVGAGGTRAFTYTAVAPGKTTIVLNYERSWEKSPIKTLTVAVEVAEDLTVTYETL